MSFLKQLKKIIICFVLSFSFVFPFPSLVFAEGDDPSPHSGTTHEGTSETLQEQLTYILNSIDTQYSKYTSVTGGSQDVLYYYSYRFGNNNSSLITTVTPNSLLSNPNTIYAFNFTTKRNPDNALDVSTVVWFYSDASPSPVSSTGTNDNALRIDRTADKFNFSRSVYSSTITSNYKYTSATVEGANIYYAKLRTSNYNVFGANMPEKCPLVYLQSGMDEKTVLALFSSGDFSYVPWVFTNSSGGMHFPSGSTLSPENTSTYSQVFQVMDVNNDNSITDQEVNYYNVTYNTNYDYSSINNGDNFDNLQFLEWVSLEIDNGNSEPGGGSGDSGGGSSSGGSVSVIVNNNSGLSVEDYNSLLSAPEFPSTISSFSEAFSVIRSFVDLGYSFASVVSAFFNFLPSWCLTLFSVLVSLCFVFIVLRLIHLFK